MLDIAANRRSRKYTGLEQMRRVLWSLCWPIYRCSPRPCFGWRTFLLRSFGAEVGSNVHVYPSARIYFPWNLRLGSWSSLGEEVLIYNLGKVSIGDRVTVSHRAHLCAGTHDYTRDDLPLHKPPITIENEAWICADAFLGPGITVGRGAVVGARAVVMKDVPAWTVVAGNPAVFLKMRVHQGS